MDQSIERLRNLEAAVDHLAVKIEALACVTEQVLARTIADMPRVKSDGVLDAIADPSRRPWTRLDDGRVAMASARAIALDAAVLERVERLRALAWEHQYQLLEAARRPEPDEIDCEA